MASLNQKHLAAMASPDEVPHVTSTDAGKVLGVNDDGEWEAVEPHGGDVFVVHVLYDTEASGYVVQEDYDDIVAAGEAAKAFIVLRDDNDGNGYICLTSEAAYYPAGDDGEGNEWSAGISWSVGVWSTDPDDSYIQYAVQYFWIDEDGYNADPETTSYQMEPYVGP